MSNLLFVQLKIIWRDWKTAISVITVMAFSLVNFAYNIINNWSIHYYTEMYDPMMTITISNWSAIGYFFMIFYPILVVLPTSTCYLKDCDTKAIIYYTSRTSCIRYWVSKMVAVFLITLVIFVVPFLMELLMSCICFDLRSTGEPSNFNYFLVTESLQELPLGYMYIHHKILYVLIYIAGFGLVSAIMACFNLAIATLPIFKYKIFTVFPLYAILYLTSVYEQHQTEFLVGYMGVLKIFPARKVDYIFWGILLALMVLTTIILVGIKTKKDEF